MRDCFNQNWKQQSSNIDNTSEYILFTNFRNFSKTLMNDTCLPLSLFNFYELKHSLKTAVSASNTVCHAPYISINMFEEKYNLKK